VLGKQCLRLTIWQVVLGARTRFVHLSATTKGEIVRLANTKVVWKMDKNDLDLLCGAEAIGKALDVNPRKAFHLLEKKPFRRRK
jgi:hypothetical protein